MSLMAGMTALAPVLSAGLQLAAAGVKKAQDVKELNVYIDRAAIFQRLFEKDDKKAEQAWTELFEVIAKALAAKGITPSMPYWDEEKGTGSPCVSIPVATVRELLDAATR